MPVAKKSAAKKSAPAKKPAAKKASALLKKPKADDKSYSKSQLFAHLAEAASAQGVGDLSKKQAAAVVDELTKAMIMFAPVGATLPGIGKLVLRQTKARIGRNPQTGEAIKIKAKKKLAFRIAKQAKQAAGIA